MDCASCLRLLQLRKVPISKEISIQFNDRLFSKTTSKRKGSLEDVDVEGEEVAALTERLQQLMLSDRAVLEKANKAFVAYVAAYDVHECKYMFRLSLLNCGCIANGMGLLSLPRMKSIKLNGADSFVKREGVDYMNITFKNKGREKQRQENFRKRELQNLEYAEMQKEREREEANENKEGDERRRAMKRQFKRQKKRKLGRYAQRIDSQGLPVDRAWWVGKKRSAPHAIREWDHYKKEESLLKQLKKGNISQKQFDKKAGYQLD